METNNDDVPSLVARSGSDESTNELGCRRCLAASFRANTPSLTTPPLHGIFIGMIEMKSKNSILHVTLTVVNSSRHFKTSTFGTQDLIQPTSNIMTTGQCLACSHWILVGYAEGRGLMCGVCFFWGAGAGMGIPPLL